MEELQMKRYVVISTNNNPDYYFYAPYQEKAWNKLGWNLCVMCTNDVDTNQLCLSSPGTIVVQLPMLNELRTETVAQASRLYAANYLPMDALIMTCDMDLIPLSDYWNPDRNNITVYGHDLTDYSYFPMGYTAMLGSKWKEVMKCSYNTEADMMRDATEYSYITMSKEWEQWWNYDWTLLTDRLKRYNIDHKIRGRQSNGFAHGRIDRGNSMAMIQGELIDAHCENNNVRHPDKINKFISLYESIYGTI